VEVTPLLPQVESPTPPSSDQVQSVASISDVPAMADAGAASTSSWGMQVDIVEATDSLQCEPTSVPQWARPTLNYRNIMEAMHARYLEGADALPSLTQHLFDRFDGHCTFEELHTRLEFMVVLL